MSVAAIATGAALVALWLAGCGGAGKTSGSGTFVYCSNISYPPEEFYQGVITRGRELRPRAVGSDIDIGSAVATRLALKAAFIHREFAALIPDLLAKQCDAIISGMNDTPARRNQVAFVDYLVVGQSLMVKRGNPHGITTPADLSGKTVAVENATTDEAFLQQRSRKLLNAGKKPITIVTFSADTAAAGALNKGKVDAYFGDSPVVAYYVAHNPSFAFAGSPVNALPVGIALRKGDPRIPKVRQAISALYADGTIQRILAKWKLTAFALEK